MTNDTIDDLDGILEHVIDDVFSSQTFTFSMYNYIRSNKLTGPDINEFIDSSTSREITQLITDLDLYLEGGDDNTHKQIREGYGHLGKPTARKIRNYLDGILDDAWRYKNEKKPGRKKGSKNRS